MVEKTHATALAIPSDEKRNARPSLRVADWENMAVRISDTAATSSGIHDHAFAE